MWVVWLFSMALAIIVLYSAGWIIPGLILQFVAFIIWHRRS